MKNDQLKENLFSFKTFRSPDKIGNEKKTQLFIQHPDMKSSVFEQCPIKEGKNRSSDYDNFMKQLEPLMTYGELQELYSDIYEFSCRLMLQRRNDSTRPEWEENYPQPLNATQYLSIWEELLKQLVTRNSMTARQACLQMIIAQHFLSNNLSLTDISNLVVVIPEKVVVFMATWQHGRDENLYGVYNLGIQDFRRVEQTLCCYVPGEVSHIENIMAREFKEKSSRNTLRTEQTTELSSESTIENTNDTTTAERNEVSSEIAKILQKDKSFDISGSVTVSKDSKIFGSISSNVSTGYNSSNSSSLSNTDAKNYAKEVTERAVERIEQKTAEKRTYKIIKEYEEIYKHGYDNRLGKEHVTGVYRWVDKIYKNELVNYGKRLVLEVEVPHPAKLYKKALKWKRKGESGTINDIVAPKTLSEFGITNASSITESNASNVDEAAAYYGVTVEWPIMHKIKNFALAYNNLGYGGQTSNTDIHTEYIDDDYKCTKISGQFLVNYKGNRTQNGQVVSYFYYGGGSPAGARGYYAPGSKDMDRVFTFNDTYNPPKEGSLSFYFSYQHVGSISGSFSLEYQLDEAILAQWQREVYMLFSLAYNQLKSRYDEELALQQEAVAAANDLNGNENYSNEAVNRLIEERELKRSCIEILSHPYGYEMGQCFHNCMDYECENCEGETETIHIPEVNQNVELEAYAKYVKFFETAFQWEILSYTFYPYYYNHKCAWYELMQTKCDDSIFEAFLQSGMAKVLVPVRPQFEKAVMWFLQTGDIYMDCDLVPETEDDQNLSLVYEMQCQDEVTVEDTWTTRVPSTLTIIQARSTYLDDEAGLPCSCALGESPFGSNESVLEGLDNVESQD